MVLPLARRRHTASLLLCSLLAGAGAGMWWTAADPVDASGAAVTRASASWWKTREWMRGDQIEQRVEQATREELSAFLTEGNAPDWVHGVNGAEIVSAILKRLSTTGDPVETAREAFAWVWRSHFTERARLEVLEIVTEAVAADERVVPSVLAGFVKGRSVDEVRSALDGFLRARPHASPRDAETAAWRFVQDAGVSVANARPLSAQAVARLWLQNDPEAAIAFAAEHRVIPMINRGLRQAMGIDPKRGVQLFRLMVDGAEDTFALGDAAFEAGFSARHFREALATKMDAIENYFPSFAARTLFEAPTEMSELAREFSAPEVFACWKRGKMTFSQGALAIASGLAERDYEGARAWLAPLSAEHRLMALRGAWQFEGLGNPQFAELCVEEPDFFSDGNYSRTFFWALASASPEARARGLELLPKELRDQWDFEMRSFSIPMEFRGEVGAAMDAAEAAPERMRARLRRVVFQSLAPDYPKEARDWLREHPDLEAELGLEFVAMVPLLPDAERGRIIAENHRLDTKGSRGWLQQTVDFAAHLGEVSPQQGVIFVNSLPEHARSRPALLLALNWSTYSPQDADAWVRSLPAGIARDGAAEGIAQALRHDAEEALTWAKQITDGATRQHAIKKLVQEWARGDLETATWLTEQGAATEAQRRELQAVIEREVLRRGGAR